MKKAPPAAASMQAAISNLHLFLAQNACFLILLAYINPFLRSF